MTKKKEDKQKVADVYKKGDKYYCAECHSELPIRQACPTCHKEIDWERVAIEGRPT